MVIDANGNGSFLFQSLDPTDNSVYTWDQGDGADFVNVTVFTVNGNVFANNFTGNNAIINANVSANIITTNTTTISSNIGLTLGTSVKAANGYNYLPNGVLLQWLTCSANSTSKTITWPIVFPTNVLNISGSSNALFTWSCLSSNTTGCNVVTSNTVTSALSLTVIGN